MDSQERYRQRVEHERRERERGKLQKDRSKEPVKHFISQHQLDEDARKARRQDNREMARSRKLHRKRKRHGRP